jgi:hypothetical protein
LKTAYKEVRNEILAYFSPFYGEFNGVWISWLLKEESEVIRCLEKNSSTWENCTPEQIEIMEQSSSVELGDLENNPYGYYGLYNKNLDIFCIREVKSGEDIASSDKRKITSGKQCENWNRTILTQLMVNIFKIPIPDDINKSVDDMWNIVMKNKHTKPLFRNKNIDNVEIDELKRAVYWGKAQRSFLCNSLKKWLQDNDLMIDDPTCGVQGKRKNK